MKKYIKLFLKEKGITTIDINDSLDSLDKIDPVTAKKIKKDIVGLDFINASHAKITSYLDQVIHYAKTLN